MGVPLTTQESKIPQPLPDKSIALGPSSSCQSHWIGLFWRRRALHSFANVVIVVINVKNHTGNDILNVYVKYFKKWNI